MKNTKSCELSSMLTWSLSNNLSFIAAKTKTVYSPLAKWRSCMALNSMLSNLNKDKTLENVNEFKFLRIAINKNLNWKKHITEAATQRCSMKKVF